MPVKEVVSCPLRTAVGRSRHGPPAAAHRRHRTGPGHESARQGAWAQLAAVLTTAAVLGAALAGLLHWYGVFEGSWLLDAAAMAMVIAAMSAALLGLLLVAGFPGFGLGVALFLLLGNPLKRGHCPEFLAEPWRTLGRGFHRALQQLLRSSAYFEVPGPDRTSSSSAPGSCSASCSSVASDQAHRRPA